MAKEKKAKKAKKSSKSGGLKALASEPLVAEVVAAALVATAAALKDSKRARALASDVGDELAKLSEAGVKRGEALWEMAIQIGKKSLSALTSEKAAKAAKPAKTPKTAKPASSKPKTVAKKRAKTSGAKKAAPSVPAR